MATAMNDALPVRLAQAESLWKQGDAECLSGNVEQAYAVYTQAHDLIMDCAGYHRHAHQKLIAVTARTGRYGEYLTDWLLLNVFYHIGIFKLVSYLQNRSSFYSHLCRHNR